MKIALYVMTLIFLLAPLGVISVEAGPIDGAEPARLTDRKLGLSFVVPTGSAVLVPEEPDLDNPFLLNGRSVARFGWQKMTVQLDVFDVRFDFNHADWLVGYAELIDRPLIGVETLLNERGVRVGKAMIDFGPSDGGVIDVYLAVSGRRGFVVSGAGAHSNPLSEYVMLGFEADGAAWGGLSPQKEFRYRNFNISIPESYGVSTYSEDGGDYWIISNRLSLDISTQIMILRYWPNTSHREYVLTFKEEIKRLGFREVSSYKYNIEAKFDLINKKGEYYEARIITLEDKSSLSIITPKVELSANTWLYGMYVFNRIISTISNN